MASGGARDHEKRRRSAAVLSWIIEVKPAEIISFGGDVPVKLMHAILEALENDDDDAEERE